MTAFPGGGSIAAYVGALGASLGTMVANLSAGKRGWDDRIEEFSAWAEKGQQLKDALLNLVDEDTQAFNRIMEAFRLPKETAEEKAARTQAIQAATQYATEVPLRTMELTVEVFELAEAMVEQGNPNSVTDGAVGALCAHAALHGAWMNVRINATSLKDEKVKNELLGKAEAIGRKADEHLARIKAKTDQRLG